MSIYDKASLVLIPSGTKTSKVYSQKPTNGDGDFTFSRSTAATRVNASGNIEKETQNLALQSNSFSTSPWSLQASASLTSGQAGYDGTNNAWLLSKAADYSRLEQNIVLSGVWTFSCYAKAGTLDWVSFENSGIASDTTFFNLNSGTLGTLGSGCIDSSIEDIGSGWYRCSVTISGTSAIMRIQPSVSNGVANGSNGNIYIQDAQLEQGLVARDYIETTTTAIYGGITDNVPRLDYTDSSCPALLLEPLRTNSFTHSESLSIGVNYKSSGTTITMNDAVSPEGYQNAAKFTGSANAVFDTYAGYLPSTTNTFSVFAKAGTCDTIAITHTATGSIAETIIDLTSGTITSTSGAQYLDSSIVDYGNGWYRASITYTSGTTAYITRFQLRETGYAYTYGWQIEHNASYATSYIPTYGSSVTRNAEGCNKTGISSLIGQTEGTMFIEFDYKINSGNMRFSLSDNSGVNWIFIATPESGTSNASRFYIRANNVVQVDKGASSYFTLNERYKLALAYKSGDWAIYGNGTLLYSGTDTFDSFTLPLQQVNFIQANGGTAGEKLPINQSLVFKTRLSNEELAALTTL